MKIHEVESNVESHLGDLLAPVFPGWRPRASLRSKNGRKKRSDASSGSFSPSAGDQILISFEPDAEAAFWKTIQERHASRETAGSGTSHSANPSVPAPSSMAPEPPVESQANSEANSVAALVKALNEAESRPGYGFVALKWFRDQVMPAVRPQWSAAQVRANALREAIDRGLVLTSKIPNPKSPSFPVTAIRVNRLLPEAAEFLGAAPPPPTEFRPIAIRGEGLSNTVLRERR